MTKFIIPLTSDYRLTADGDRNFVLERRATVDPTKAPNWAARKAADPTLSAEPYEVWREDGCYGITDAGLDAAIKTAVLKTAVINTASATSEAQSLAEFFGAIAEEMRKVTATIDALLSPNPPLELREINGELAEKA